MAKPMSKPMAKHIDQSINESETKVLQYIERALVGVSDEWRKLIVNEELYKVFSVLPKKNVVPPVENIFEFTKLTDLSKIKVVIVGQDPYPKAGDAHGLAFSCLTGVPASLKNIYKCLLKHKLINEIPNTGNLEYWAKQGVLLINTSLTVKIGKPNSHAKFWDIYFNTLISNISKIKPLIFMLWGNNARIRAQHLSDKAIVYEWTHPSPLAQSKQSFSDCPHFSDANKALFKLGSEPIDWNVDPPQGEVEISFGAGPKTQVVFTDGSCYPNKVSPAAIGGYASAFALGSMKDTVLYGSIPNRPHFASNQRAEGYAILKVLEYLTNHLNEFDECIIVADSEFWIKMFEIYMPKWVDSDCFDEKKNPDMTKKLWGLYQELTDEHMKTIKFRHVKSHDKEGWSKYPEDSYEYFCYVNNHYVDELASYARTTVEVGKDIVTDAKYQ